MIDKDPRHTGSAEGPSPHEVRDRLGREALRFEQTRSTRLIEMPDRRTVEIYQTGSSNHYPIFFLHGSPGHAQNPIPRSFRLGLHQVQAISYSRPGYGRSDRHEDRRVVDEVARIEVIADTLGLEEFSIIGRSGGGPSALAAATLLPDRVLSTVVLAGPTSPSLTEAIYRDSQDWSSGMSEQNQQFHDYAQNDPSRLHQEMQELSRNVSNDPRHLLNFLDPQLTDSDKGHVGHPLLRELLLQSYADGLPSSDHMGWYDDTLALHTDWGIDLREVARPLLLWYGENDPFCPPKYGYEIASHIPSAQLVVTPNVAHFESFALVEPAIAWARDNARYSF